MSRHNLSTVIDFEFQRTIRKRQFWVLTLITPVLVMIIGGLLIASNTSTSRSVDSSATVTNMSFVYSDSSGVINPAIAKTAGGTHIDDRHQGIEKVRSGSVDAFIAFPRDPLTETVQIWATDAGLFSNSKYSALAQTLLQRSTEKSLNNPAAVQILQGNVAVTTTTFSHGEVSAGFAAILPGLFFVLAFFIVIVFMGNQMLNSTLEEKENRVTEMILTTINPNNLLIGKVISLFTIGIIQIVVFAVPFVVGYVFFKNQLHLPDVDLSGLVFEPEKMIVGTLILIGGFSLFIGTLVALGAIMPTAKDAAPLFTIVIFSVVIPLYAIGFTLSEPTMPIVQILAYFPYTAPITSLLLNAFGTLPLWQAIIIILELFILAAVVMRIAARLFRYGSIQYSSRVKIRDVLTSQPKKAGSQR